MNTIVSFIVFIRKFVTTFYHRYQFEWNIYNPDKIATLNAIDKSEGKVFTKGKIYKVNQIIE